MAAGLSRIVLLARSCPKEGLGCRVEDAWAGLAVERLPAYAPELNSVEGLW